MQNLLNELVTTLEKDERLVIGGKLMKNKVVELALALDSSLMKLLLKNKTIKTHFFQEFDGVLVFDKIDFQKFVSNKQFLPDSYTSFKNKVGLIANDEYLSELKETVLAWPYKDCILEGGQTEENQKRKEIFWNEKLAPDEIDRLLSPKVLTNFKRYDKKGGKEVDNISFTDNLIVKGNNLIALHSLKKVYSGGIKQIYIDPPYNTGGDSFGYNDNFNHSSWLTFFKNRIEVAKELLKPEGSIWINLDDNEAHYAKVICDEIFGRENFVSNVIWQKKYAPQNDAKFFSDNHDHILVYAKNINSFKINLLPRSDEMDSRYSNPDDDKRGSWASDNLLVKTYSADYDYPIENPAGRKINPPNGSCWRVSKKKFQELLEDNRIWFGKDGKNVPRLKRFLSEVKQGITPVTIWSHKEVGHNQDARRELFALVDTNIFKTPKPERLISRILSLGSDEGDIILDFFMGSGTTCAVAMKMNRQFIGIEQMDYCKEVTVERMKKVIKGEQGGISKEFVWKGGGTFIYCELAKLNANYVKKIGQLNNASQVNSVLKELIELGHTNYLLTTESGMLEDLSSLSLEQQQQFLLDILDKNQLYIAYSEIADKENDISKRTKELNNAFYNI